MNSQVLKPCPFCGGKPNLIETGEAWFYVRCTAYGCEAESGCFDDESMVVSNWNTRATPAPIPDHLPDATKMVAPTPDAGEGVGVAQAIAWMNKETQEATTYPVVVMDWDDEKEPVESLMSIEQHNRIVSALQASSGIPDGWKRDADRYRWLQKTTPYRFKKMQDASVTDGGDVFYFHSDIFDAAIDAAMLAASPAPGDSTQEDPLEWSRKRNIEEF